MEPIKGPKAWKSWPEECPGCGGDSVEIETEYAEEGWAGDGDAVRCTECGTKGIFNVSEPDDTWTDWDW